MNVRVKIKNLRRRELIDATRDIVAEIGFEATTVSKIAKRAGFSIGFMHHHFPNKEALLAETMRVVYSDMREIIVDKIRRSTDPQQRLKCILEGQFDQRIFTRANAYIWISFIPRIPFNPSFGHLQNVIERRFYSTTIIESRKIENCTSPETLVSEAMMLVDYHWLRLGIGSEDFEELRASALTQVAKLVDF